MSKFGIKIGIEVPKDVVICREGVSFRKESKNKVVSSGLRKERTINKLRILVVDDYVGVGNMLYEYFSWCGYNVKVVEDGAEAIGLCMSEVFDLVFVDLVMPNVSGYDVIKSLNRLGDRPKIGLVTGWSEKLKLGEGECLSVDFIVKKPFNLSEIAKIINDIFERTVDS